MEALWSIHGNIIIFTLCQISRENMDKPSSPKYSKSLYFSFWLSTLMHLKALCVTIVFTIKKIQLQYSSEFICMSQLMILCKVAPTGECVLGPRDF